MISQGDSTTFTESDICLAYEYNKTLYQLKMLCLGRTPRTLEGKVVCYHGTTQDRAEKIQASGLRANQEDTGFSRAFRGKGKKGYLFVYIEDSGRKEAVETAWYNSDKEKRNSPPVLITCEIDPKRLIPDLDSGHEESFKIYVGKGSLPTTTIQDLSGTEIPPEYADYREARDKELSTTKIGD